MKKKLVAGMLTTVLLVGGATAALAATDSAKLDAIKSLTQQLFGIQKQIADKEVEAGLITQQQADAIKSSIDLRQKSSDQAIVNGQVPGLGMRGNMKFGKGQFNNGQPWTDDQIKVWSDAMQARLKAQEEAMKSSGKFTDDQIKTWSDAMQAQLKVQEVALKNGTAIPGGLGGFGMHGGKGMRGGYGGGCWGGPLSGTSTPNTSTSTTTN
jgi:hypothetical protein